MSRRLSIAPTNFSLVIMSSWMPTRPWSPLLPHVEPPVGLALKIGPVPPMAFFMMSFTRPSGAYCCRHCLPKRRIRRCAQTQSSDEKS
jgi:hypothetical protein